MRLRSTPCQARLAKITVIFISRRQYMPLTKWCRCPKCDQGQHSLFEMTSQDTGDVTVNNLVETNADGTDANALLAKLLREGKSDRQIAAMLKCAPSTVWYHRKRAG